MIYCNLSDDSRKNGIEIGGNRADIRDELAAIFTELEKIDAGELLIYAALVQSVNPEWEETYDTEIRQFPDPNRRRA